MLSQGYKCNQYKYRKLATNTAKYLQQIKQSDHSISVQVIIINVIIIIITHVLYSLGYSLDIVKR